MTPEQVEMTTKAYRKLKFLETCQKQYERDLQVTIPLKTIERMIEGLIDEDEWLEIDYDGSYGMDTAPRDQLGDVFAQYIGVNHWPMYGDDQEFKDEFHRKMISTIKNETETGHWKFVPD